MLVCNTMVHFAKTTGSVSEITDRKAGSSRGKDYIAQNIYSVRKAENLYRENKLLWGIEYLKVRNFREIILKEIRTHLRKLDRRLWRTKERTPNLLFGRERLLSLSSSVVMLSVSHS